MRSQEGCHVCKIFYRNELIAVQHMISVKHHKRYESVQKAAGKQISHFCPVCGVGGIPDMNTWALHLSSALHMTNYDQYMQIFNAQKKALKQPKALNSQNSRTRFISRIATHPFPDRSQTVKQKSLLRRESAQNTSIDKTRTYQSFHHNYPKIGQDSSQISPHTGTRDVDNVLHYKNPYRIDSEDKEHALSSSQYGNSLPASEIAPLRLRDYHDTAPFRNPSVLSFRTMPEKSNIHPCSNDRDSRSRYNQQRNLNFTNERKARTLLSVPHSSNRDQGPLKTRKSGSSGRYTHRLVQGGRAHCKALENQTRSQPPYYLGDKIPHDDNSRCTPDQHDYVPDRRDRFVTHSHERDGASKYRDSRLHEHPSSSDHPRRNRNGDRLHYFRQSPDPPNIPARRHSRHHSEELLPISGAAYLRPRLAHSHLRRNGIPRRSPDSRRNSNDSHVYHSRVLTFRDSGNYHAGTSKSPRVCNHPDKMSKGSDQMKGLVPSDKESQCDKVKEHNGETQHFNLDIETSQFNGAGATNPKDSNINNFSAVEGPVEQAERVQDGVPVAPFEALITELTHAKVVADPQKSEISSEVIITHKKKSCHREIENEVANSEEQPQEIMEQRDAENQVTSITLDVCERQFAFMSTVEKTHEISRLSEEIEEITRHQTKLTHYIRQLKYIRSQKKEEKKRLRRRLSTLLLEMNQSDSQAETGSSDNFDDSTPSRIEFEESSLEVIPSSQSDARSDKLLLSKQSNSSAPPDNSLIISLLEDDDTLPPKRAKLDPICRIQLTSTEQPTEIVSSKKFKKHRRGYTENILPTGQAPSDPLSSSPMKNVILLQTLNQTPNQGTLKVNRKRNIPNSQCPSMETSDAAVDCGPKVNEKRLRYIRGLLNHPKCREYTFEELDRLINDYGKDKLLQSQTFKGKQK